MARSTFDAIMTTDSPSQSFASSQGDAMDIETTPATTPTITQHAEKLLNNTGTTLNTFHPFPRLDAALRKRIWTLALPSPRTRFLELHSYNSIDYTPKIRYIPPLPPLFHASHESRALIIASEGGSIIQFTRSTSTSKDLVTLSCYFNFSHDILFLSSRFTAACNTTETSRLHTLSAILPSARLIQRLLITYSGFDDYSHIGPVMRPYAALEVLYIGMVDGWSNRAVRRMVRRGVPKRGVVAGKIEEVVRETEAEETDDDEESEEMLGRRVGVRERRRILEVEVRLDE
ncbi:Nn.00g075200.m01.CDS01 [Neocucurbitaria sp. VM-36]